MDLEDSNWARESFCMLLTHLENLAVGNSKEMELSCFPQGTYIVLLCYSYTEVNQT